MVQGWWIALVGAWATQEQVDFNRDVRPILSGHCFECHGPDAETRRAGLRLDEPGVDGEELIARITSDDASEVMPPAEGHKPLKPAQIDILRRWIASGGAYRGHWSFQPIRSPALPAVENDAWIRQPLDRFVLAQLESVGRAPSEEADRRTLLRRATLALTGLPPTRDEMAAFLADDQPGAYERVVDRLLASMAHAERMTLAWMDAARYGDTSVFHADGPRTMWPWRDWVIRSYAANVPFDEMTVQQLAGDLLPDRDADSLIATGFHRNHGTTDEGGVIAEEARVEYMVDRVKTTANVWLGLTMECSQCHDHKYDPITQREYFEFYAFFNQSQDAGMQTRNGNADPKVPAPTAAQTNALAEAEKALVVAEEQLAAATAPADALAAWVESERATLLAMDAPVLSPWSMLGPIRAEAGESLFQTVHVDPKAIDLAEEVEGHSWTDRSDLVDGKTHALQFPGNSAFYLTRTLTVDRAGGRELSLGSDDTLQVWVNGELILAKEVFRGVTADSDRVEARLHAGENTLLVKVGNGGGPAGVYFNLLGSSLPNDVQEALRAATCSPEQHATLSSYFVRNVWETGVALATAVTAASTEVESRRAAIPTVMVLADRPEGRMTYLLERGMYDAPRKDEVLFPATPSFLPAMAPDLPRNRLGLAQWIVDPDHPLTARVAVNRYWGLLFGEGMVATPMDFGAQGAWPTHPDLLDHLARAFVESGWDIRSMLRSIVTSATFRQSSRVTPELLEFDPTNRLLGRAPRLRLQGEFVRDQALAVSGLLVDRVGGPGVKPYQPPGLWNAVSLDRNVRFSRDDGESLYRKSMYIYWKRSAPMPVMTLFDAPTREKCLVLRTTTNTPLQALVTLNDEQFVEAARHLAARMIREGGDSFESRLDVGCELCTGRPADETRRAVLRELVEAQRESFEADSVAAESLLGVGASPRDESLDAVEHATWTVLASVLLNLDETLNRE